MLPGYAELHCRSNYSFGRGASHPEELIGRAHALGQAALAITDECSVSGLALSLTLVSLLYQRFVFGRAPQVTG